MRNKYRKFSKRENKDKQIAKYKLVFDNEIDIKSIDKYTKYFNRMINSSISVAVPSYVKIEKL